MFLSKCTKFNSFIRSIDHFDETRLLAFCINDGLSLANKSLKFFFSALFNITAVYGVLEIRKSLAEVNHNPLFLPKRILWRDSQIGDACSLLYSWDPNSFWRGWNSETEFIYARTKRSNSSLSDFIVSAFAWQQSFSSFRFLTSSFLPLLLPLAMHLGSWWSYASTSCRAPLYSVLQAEAVQTRWRRGRWRTSLDVRGLSS